MSIFEIEPPPTTISGKLVIGTKPGQEWSSNGLKMKFCWCPPGEFSMGSPQNEIDRETNEVQRDVKLTKGFWLGKYEVTQSEWQQVMGTTIAEQIDKAFVSTSRAGTGDNYPIYFVNRPEMKQFCELLTKQEQVTGRLPAGWVYRLPTEEQWEYGCRAGTTTATAFGDRLDSSQANFHGTFPYNGAAKGINKEASVPVGSYKANDWGLCDMHGNVWEFCDSLTQKGSAGVYRGGSWYRSGRFCRSASREMAVEEKRYDYVGFRVALISLND